MTAVFKLDGVELPDGAVLVDSISGLPSAAWYGEPSTAGLVIDDPDGDYDLAGWHTFTVDETDCDKPRIFSGWLTGRRINRGPYRSGPGRIWDVDIIDLNALFSFELFRANSAQRPAETDVERVEFCIESAAMAGTPCVDNGRFNTAGPLNISAADFVPQFPVELLTSTAGQCGKQFYAYWDHDEEEVSFHYDLVGAGPSATIAISNIEADADATTFFPYVDAQLTRAPESVYTGVLLKYLGGYVYGRNQDTIDSLSPSEFSPINFLRDQSLTSDRIGTLATANSYVQTYLDQAAEEQETLVVTVRLPAENVNHVEAGDIIEVTFTHLPGFETVQEMPVIRRSVKPSEGQVDYYDVTLELTRAQEIRPNDGGDPDELPTQDPCDIASIALVQGPTVASMASTASNPLVEMHGPSWAAPPTPGNVLVYAVIAHGGQTDPGDIMGWTALAKGTDGEPGGDGGVATTLSTYWKIAGSSEVTTPSFSGGNFGNPNLSKNAGVLIEISGVDTLDLFAELEGPSFLSTFGQTIAPTAGRMAFMLTIGAFGQILGFPITPDSDVTEVWEDGNPADDANPGTWIGYRIVEDTTGSYDINGQLMGSFNTRRALHYLVFTCSGGGDAVPPVGQAVVHEDVGEGDGTTVTFNTRFPYAVNSLRVFVDGVQIIAGLTQSDPTTGEFTLDFAPQGPSVIRGPRSSPRHTRLASRDDPRRRPHSGVSTGPPRRSSRSAAPRRPTSPSRRPSTTAIASTA